MILGIINLTDIILFCTKINLLEMNRQRSSNFPQKERGYTETTVERAFKASLKQLLSLMADATIGPRMVAKIDKKVNMAIF
jgi:hypothetical protein